MTTQTMKLLCGAIFSICFFLQGCGGGGESAPEVPLERVLEQPSNNTAPAISGDSVDYVRAGQNYRTQALASDAEDDTLLFEIKLGPVLTVPLESLAARLQSLISMFITT